MLWNLESLERFHTAIRRDKSIYLAIVLQNLQINFNLTVWIEQVCLVVQISHLHKIERMRQKNVFGLVLIFQTEFSRFVWRKTLEQKLEF